MDEAVPRETIMRRLSEIESERAAATAKLKQLEVRQSILLELLDETVGVEFREDPEENRTLTDLIIHVIAQTPGLPSRGVARFVAETRGTSSPSTKTVQTIIGQLLRRNPPPITRDEDGALYPLQAPAPVRVPAPGSEFEDFPAALEDEDDDMPF